MRSSSRAAEGKGGWRQWRTVLLLRVMALVIHPIYFWERGWVRRWFTYELSMEGFYFFLPALIHLDLDLLRRYQK